MLNKYSNVILQHFSNLSRKRRIRPFKAAIGLKENGTHNMGGNLVDPIVKST